MSKLWMSVAVTATLTLLWCCGSAVSADPKYTIKEVMKMAHQGKPALCAKAVKGEASVDELKQLLAYYEALAANKPPRGDANAWKERTSALVESVKALIANPKDKDALAKYNKAVGCKGCHSEHKPT
ncbi:MAG: hypothetical protein RMJ19_08295 [Gemmatales bacterium]|nr:hypothetical protein [Gemmatales bacterium]MDW8175658.1 hypothetical protein [Gemmatales bacterium]